MEYVIKDKTENNYHIAFAGDFEQFGDYLRYESNNGEFIKCKNKDNRKILVRASEIIRVIQVTEKQSEMLKAGRLMQEAKEIFNKWN